MECMRPQPLPVRERPRRHLRSALLLTALLAAPLAAQHLDLTWPEVTVTAHLDADGRLRVRERQVIRFTGFWNGGERTFNIPSGQRLTVDGMVRLDSATGASRPMIEGDLDVVDGWRWDGTALRWRSRLPEDPPFNGAWRVYELAFSYANILVPQPDGTYLLDHDFGFSDRNGAIDRFRVRLTIDSAWAVPDGFTGEYDAGRLEPGYGYVVTVPLRRVAAGVPAAVRFGASAGQKQALLAALVGGLLLVFARLLVHDGRLGRFRAVMTDDEVTPAFLQEQVFSRLPEVVGAAWDDSTTSSEVAATLARLVQEKKLESRVETLKALVFTRHRLFLTLRVSRESLRDHELALVNALFPGGARTTDTDKVREHYAKTGFDPAALLDPQLRRLIPTVLGGEPDAPLGSKWTALIALVGSLVALALLFAGVRDGGDIELTTGLFGLLAALPGFLVSRLAADEWRRRPEGLVWAGLFMAGGVGGTAFAYWWMLLRDPALRVHLATLAGLVVWQLVLAFNVTVHAWVRQSRERLVQRRRLAAARQWFQAQLRRPEPQLKDAWYPWLVAFGLGPQVDKWFKAFGATVGTRAVGSGRVSSSGGFSSSSSSASGGFAGFGGGGGFAGGGGGSSFGGGIAGAAAFGAAIGGMAAAVAKPSSSGSSGGGGGGGSSGGGGGGGW